MTLRKKTLSIILLITICAAVIIALLAHTIVLRDYIELEENYMRQNTQRIVNALNYRLHGINTSLQDWAIWDDTCAFVKGTYPGYVTSNLQDSSLVNLGLNLMVFTEATGQIIYQKMVDLETEQEIPVPFTLQEHITRILSPFPSAWKGRVGGIVLVPEGIMLIAAHPILATSGEGPACGMLLMGRYLDQATLDELEATTQLSITLQRLDDPQVPQEVLATLSLDRPVMISTPAAQTIAGYALIADIYGKPALIMSTAMRRDIYLHGQMSMLYFFLLLLLVGIVFGLTMMIFLNRAILARVFNLAAEVSAIGVLSDPSRRVAVTGADELTRLEESINTMLTALEQARAEQVRAEAALREYSQRLETMVSERTMQLQSHYTRLDAILRSTTDGIVVIAADGTLMQMNPVAKTWLSQSLTTEDARLLHETMQQIVQQNNLQTNTVLELQGLDLELNAARLTESQSTEGFQPPPDEAKWTSSSPAAVIAIHDVSHLKALERMQASFVSAVSHELRTPVTAIKLYINLLRRKPAEIERYLSALEQVANQQIQLIEAVLALSRMNAGQLELERMRVDLNALVKKSITTEIVHLAESRNVHLNYHFAARNLIILGDKERLEQVIYALVSNGLQYTLPGGEVTVATGLGMREGRKWAWLMVTDTGIGISEEEFPHIYERFYRGERAQQIRASGIGLGLTLAKEIITLHGGTLDCVSQKDKGSSFTVWLPGVEIQPTSE